MARLIPFGRYILTERLSVGGMAEIYKAKTRDPVTGRDKFVAIKKMLPQMADDKSFIDMFKTEADVVKQLKHPSICQIYENDQIDSSYYIAMELIEGKDLQHIINRNKKLRIFMEGGPAAYIIYKILMALEYAHTKKSQEGRPLNIIHRDISPQNIIISYRGEVKLIDFGVAKAVIQRTITQAGVLKGKFAYMAPEQLQGKTIDRRVDIFSAGIVLAELLICEQLFAGNSDFAVLEKVRNVEIPDLKALNPAIPGRLLAIVLKALNKEPEGRYQSSEEMALDLFEFLQSRPNPYSQKDLAQYMRQAYKFEYQESEPAEESASSKVYLSDKTEMRNPIVPPPLPPDIEAEIFDEKTIKMGFDEIERLYGKEVAKVVESRLMGQSGFNKERGVPSNVIISESLKMSDREETDLSRRKSKGFWLKRGVTYFAILFLGLVLGAGVFGVQHRDWVYQQYNRWFLKRPLANMIIQTSPIAGVSVLVDGKAVQSAPPISLKQIIGGVYTISVISKGYQPGYKIVDLKDGETRNIRIELKRIE